VRNGSGGAPAYRLDNCVRDYDWGSRTAIPELLGVPPAGRPQAELWMGTHPSAPSRLAGDGTLADRIEADPEGELGDAVLAEFGPRLPFLFKVLAAARPLSLQAHPTPEQAAEGHAAEHGRDVPLSAPQRNYKDRSHKPEVLCALTPFRALAGFRDPAGSARLLAGLGVPALAGYRERLAAPGGLRQVVSELLTLPAGERADLVGAVAAACRTGPDGDSGGGPDGGFAAERALAVKLAAQYPADPGVVIALLLNYVELAPGEALFLPAGNLHAYLSGTGVELMANSDNVLRGGLTNKHIDVPELLRVLDFAAGPAPLLAPRPGPDGGLEYRVPVREFRLTRFDAGLSPSVVDGGAPQILLCVEGSVEVSGLDGEDAVRLPRGGSAFVPASRKAVMLAGRGAVFRAITNLG
jgi:mannose-6-phosphate isomerase